MSNPHRTNIAIVVAAALAVPSLAAAQHPAAFGNLMTAFIQPRHIKLGLAGNEQNWPYAAYQLDQLRETFADIAECSAAIWMGCSHPVCRAPAEILPKYRDLSIPDLITSTVKEPLAALDRAIRAKDGAQFTAAYGQLTAACNACHQSYDRTAIVIQPPTAAAPFSRSAFPLAYEVSGSAVIFLRSRRSPSTIILCPMNLK